jgi:hypothetical protein
MTLLPAGSGQESEEKGQKAEVRSLRSGIRGKKTEDRRQKMIFP